MPFHWSAVTIDCADPDVLATFWASLLRWETSTPLPGWRRVSSGDENSGLDINFQPVPEPKTSKTRMHLDLTVARMDEAINEVEALGGRATDERHVYVEGIVQVMADPEGNEFCITQYLDHRAPNL